MDHQCYRHKIVVESGADMLDFCTLQPGAYLEHDCLLGSFAVAGKHRRVKANSVLVGTVEDSQASAPKSVSATESVSGSVASASSISSGSSHGVVLRDGTGTVSCSFEQSFVQL